MSTLVVDASVAAKWFLEEPDSAIAETYLASDASLLAPQLIHQEVAGAILRAYRTGRLGRPEAEAALRALGRMLASSAIGLFPNEGMQARAEAIALDLKHPLPDCLYLALAQREGAELITADAVFAQRAAPGFPFVRLL